MFLLQLADHPPGLETGSFLKQTGSQDHRTNRLKYFGWRRSWIKVSRVHVRSPVAVWLRSATAEKVGTISGRSRPREA